MRWLAVFAFLLSAPAAQANTVSVISGEHDTFSRLVLRLPAEGDWQLGRTATGYALKIGLTDLRYDVSQVFDLIPRDRLSGIFTDPVTGDLQLRVACDCHAIPFSLDAQTLVIDLRDGPPPATSSFELTLAGEPMLPLQAKVTPRPRQDTPPQSVGQGYDWLADPRPAPAPVLAPLILPKLAAQDFAELQQALVTQMAEGAARGVVVLALPPGIEKMPPAQPVPDAAQLRVTDTAGLRVVRQRSSPETMQADGAECVADERLNLAQWGQIADVPGQLARARIDLVGEFDVPDPAAVVGQVRLYLFLGFGAEAAALMLDMPPDDQDAPLWSAMAQVIDGDAVSSPVFDGMAQCDSFAALWSLLAAAPERVEKPNLASLQRAFSALPRHLRLTLGPRITERLLALDQPAAVQGILGAMGRGATATEAASLLVESGLDLHTGAVDDAVANAEAALEEGGIASPAALIAVVRGKIAAGSEIDPSIVVSLEAMLQEHAGTAIAADLTDARNLALIGSGQFAAAHAQNAGALPPAFWDVLARKGTDDEVLHYAFVVPESAVSPVAAGTFAQRLQDLGFVTAADDWAALARDGADDSRNDSAASRLSVDGAALVQDVDLPDAARLRLWQQDWAAIATSDADPWKDLAAQVALPPTTAAEPALAKATRLVEGSKTTRALIAGLLQSPGE
jgi:hypothetical protein